MFDSRGLPDYPPPRNAWEFPPPAVSKGWFWAALVATVLAVSVALALTVVAVVAGDDDYPGVIQDTGLIRVIEDECELMTSTVESMPVEGPALQQAATVIDQNEAVAQMLETIRKDPEAIDADRPAALWLSDWDSLLAARESYAAAVAKGGEPNLRVPEDGNRNPINLRMDDAFFDEPACTVPYDLLNPYPSPDADV